MPSQAWWSFIGSVLGALVAGYAGVWFALARVRRERGFDHRLSWTKEMLSAIHQVAKWTDQAAEAESQEAFLALTADPPQDLVVRFDLLVAEARAFASTEALSALNRVAKCYDEMNAAPDPQTPEQQRELLARQIDALRMASEALGDDVRNMLRLEPTSESSWPFSVPKQLPWQVQGRGAALTYVAPTGA